MTKREAYTLNPGDTVCAKITDPAGGDSRWDPERRRYCDTRLPADEVVTFERIIPKVRIVRNGPWDDGHDEMLFCRRADGTRAWIHISNARKVEPERVCERLIEWLGVTKNIRVAGHSFAWSGKIPCTGVRRCIYCGKEKNP